MSVTPADKLAGVLPVVISGGRPELKQRPTTNLITALHGVTADPVWLVRDDHAGAYERDGHEVITYPLAEAEAYAAAHWTSEEPFAAGAFLGAFAGREWACRVAEERGCWAVLQLDDNIRRLGCFNDVAASARIVRRCGGLGLFADILSAVTLATNSRMTGAQLDAIHPGSQVGVFARAGFPYSLFIEQVGHGREAWHGPGEDDVMHAYQYGVSATTATAAIVVPLHYRKEHRSQTGMRKFYGNNRRTVGLQRLAPEMVRIGVRKTHANGRGSARVFHTMLPGAIRTPLVVADKALYRSAASAVSRLATELAEEFRSDLTAKVNRRAAARIT